MPPRGRSKILLNGIGTGLDLFHLPACHRYTGLDLTPAMLERAAARRRGLDLVLVQGDSQALPFADGSFHYVVLHLILAVVSDAQKALAETARVLKPGGLALLLDKFLRPGEFAPLRRALSPLAARIATRTDVVFEDALAAAPQLAVRSNEPALFGGWFRRIVLEKT